jgi:hypothetical protein
MGLREERREDAEQEVVLQLVHLGVEPPVVLLPDSPDEAGPGTCRCG